MERRQRRRILQQMPTARSGIDAALSIMEDLEKHDPETAGKILALCGELTTQLRGVGRRVRSRVEVSAKPEPAKKDRRAVGLI